MEPLCGTKLSLARTYGQIWQVESISHLAEQGMKQASIFFFFFEKIPLARKGL